MEKGFEKGVVAAAGLIAHGRGEALDYFLGEKTSGEAKSQIEAGAAMLLLAKNPVISVNGNSTALCAGKIVQLSKALGAPIEVNLFYRAKKRLKLVEREFRKLGVKILGVNGGKKIPNLSSKRKFVDSRGIWNADAVLVMLEDGDRAEHLRKMGKKVVAVDLNPLSRTARKANITIVDNVTRAVPLLSKKISAMKRWNKEKLLQTLKKFSGKKSLARSEALIRNGLE